MNSMLYILIFTMFGPNGETQEKVAAFNKLDMCEYVGELILLDIHDIGDVDYQCYPVRTGRGQR